MTISIKMCTKAKAIPVLVISSIIFLVLNNLNPSALGQPALQVSPTCGPAKTGFNIQVNTSGFRPNTQVDWKLSTSDNQIPTYGYFQTNSSGGFSDVVFVGDLKEGHYKMYFGLDPNADGIMDNKSPITYANITMPCPK